MIFAMSKISQKQDERQQESQRQKLPLTAEQMRIVRTKRRAVEVRAYAGTGKTSTLSARVEKLLMRGARPEDVLVLTFSNEGVRVLKNRLPNGVTVKTMHGYALSLIKPRPRLPTDKQVRKWLSVCIGKELDRVRASRRELLVERLGTPPDVRLVAQVLDLMAATGQNAKDLGLSQSDRFSAVAYFPSFFDRLARRFAAKVKDKGCVRFGGMIRRGVEALDGSATVPFKHLLVDEWQDCSPAQGQLVRGLADRVDTVMVLGDPRQAIFGFAGASPMRLATLLGKAKTYPLTVSFRLHQADAALATAFIRQEEPTALAIRGRNERGHRARLLRCADPAKQTERVVEQVQAWLAKGVEPSAIAILGRTKEPIRDVEQGLIHAGLTSTAVNSKPGVRSETVMAALKVFVQIEDLREHPLQGHRMARLLEKNAQREVPASTLKTYVRNLCGALASGSREGLYAMCCKVLLGIGVGGDVKKRKHLQIELNRWRALSHEFDSFSALREDVRQRRKAGHIHTSTVHSAKGGEWDHVIVLNVANGSMPFYMARSPSAMDEERSVFYVAITRARKQLVLVEADLVHSDNKLRGGSQFVSDPRVMRQLLSTG